MGATRALLVLAAHATVCHGWWGVGSDLRVQSGEENNSPAKYRIVGGQDITQPIPWMATIGKIYDNDKKHPQHFCGATLIHESYVLTAAHCLASKELSELVVSIGGLDRSKFNDPQWEHHTIQEKICHPSYITDTEENDICLLKLAEPSQKQVAYINRDPLGGDHAPNEYEQPGYPAAILGWGTMSEMATTTPDRLQGTTVPLLALADCQALVPEWQPEKVDERTICAGYSRGGKDSCAGDSGGPLLNDQTVIGVSSWGLLGCARPDNPGVYQRVAYFADWIQSITGPLEKQPQVVKQNKNAPKPTSGPKAESE